MKLENHSSTANSKKTIFLKRFILSKKWGGFDENKLDKSSIEKNAGLLKRQNSDIACWASEKLILRPNYSFWNFSMPKTVKFEIF